MKSKTVRIPIVADYSEKEMLIAGVKKEDMGVIPIGSRKVPVIYVDVPEEQASALKSLTWAETNYDRDKRRRCAAGKGDLTLDGFELDLEDHNAEDPLQKIINNEALDFTNEIIAYLESLDPLYAVIFKERLDGNFNKSDIAKKIGKTVPTGHRWVKRVEELVQEFYEMRNNL